MVVMAQIMKECPDIVGSAKVLLFTYIDERHQFTGNCRQIVAGQLMGPMKGLAICKYDEEDAYYLFGCDEDWESITDTWHETIEEAMEQAEFEYKGSKETWLKKP